MLLNCDHGKLCEFLDSHIWNLLCGDAEEEAQMASAAEEFYSTRLAKNTKRRSRGGGAPSGPADADLSLDDRNAQRRRLCESEPGGFLLLPEAADKRGAAGSAAWKTPVGGDDDGDAVGHGRRCQRGQDPMLAERWGAEPTTPDAEVQASVVGGGRGMRRRRWCRAAARINTLGDGGGGKGTRR